MCQDRLKKNMKSFTRIAEIKFKQLLNTSLEHYCYANLLHHFGNEDMKLILIF
jgi:hypothetical protein